MSLDKTKIRIVWAIIIVTMLGPFVMTFIINGFRMLIKKH